MGNKALVFAGQGAQFVGMGKDLVEAYPECRSLFEKADAVLGYAISDICFNGPEEELTKTNHCQPAIFVASMACYTALGLKSGEMSVSGVAGLSLGEWSALHMAGALSFEDTLRVLEARGRFMQEACDEQDGTMVSVMGLTPSDVQAVCDTAGVQVANLNSEEQTVLSGPRAAVLQAETLAKEKGAKRTIVLNVAGAYHSRLMDSAAEKLRGVLEDVAIQTPRIPVLANVTGSLHGGPDEIREAMLRQVNGTVNWLGCVRWLLGQGVDTFVECGPGKVLSGLIRRIDRDSTQVNVQDCASLEAAVEALNA
jgi:[acyl-carrier-protein] S-malonyltransferase